MLGSHRRHLGAALVGMTMIVAACSAAHPSAARKAAEQHYIDGVHFSATDIGKYQTDSQLVRLGNAVCDDFRANASNQQVADKMEQLGGRNLPPQDLGAIISSAVQNLCPAYAGRLNPVSQ